MANAHRPRCRAPAAAEGAATARGGVHTTHQQAAARTGAYGASSTQAAPAAAQGCSLRQRLDSAGQAGSLWFGMSELGAHFADAASRSGLDLDAALWEFEADPDDIATTFSHREICLKPAQGIVLKRDISIHLYGTGLIFTSSFAAVGHPNPSGPYTEDSWAYFSSSDDHAPHENWNMDVTQIPSIEFDIYPNPASDFANLSHQVRQMMRARIEVQELIRGLHHL